MLVENLSLNADIWAHLDYLNYGFIYDIANYTTNITILIIKYIYNNKNTKQQQ